jgi:hypothetical protein
VQAADAHVWRANGTSARYCVNTGSRTTSRPTGPPDIRTFAATNKIELVATYVSYLNPVECHFSALTQFVVAHADYRD